MIRVALLAAVALMLALCAPADARRGACYPRGSTTITQHDGGRVFSMRDQYGEFACSERYGRVIDLLPAGYESTEHHHVNRRWVVFLRTWCDGEGGCYHEVVERSLRSGRTRFAVINGGGDPGCGDTDDCGFDSIGALLLKPNGSAAWIGCPGDDVCRDFPRYVERRDNRGDRIVDRGKRIPPSSLRLVRGGRAFTWLNDGVRHRATLR